MRKLIIAAVAVFSSVAFTACTKENVAPKPGILATEDGNKDQLGQGDRTNGNRDPLGQADGNPIQY